MQIIKDVELLRLLTKLLVCILKVQEVELKAKTLSQWGGTCAEAYMLTAEVFSG